jgi:uncharacterized C2H2 Zn-finger protein
MNDLDGKGWLCPRCDFLYRQLRDVTFCLRCWNTHVNVAVSFIEVIKYEMSHDPTELQ